jgi:hypothetical protein
MNVGWTIGIFFCVRRVTLQPIGFDTDIMVYQFEQEFWQSCSRKLLVFWKQPRQVCVCACACVLACACARLRASALVHAFHKSTVVNIYLLKFLIDYNNTVIKSKILKIKLSATVHPLLYQTAPHFMYDFRLRGAALMATFFPLVYGRPPEMGTLERNG